MNKTIKSNLKIIEVENQNKIGGRKQTIFQMSKKNYYSEFLIGGVNPELGRNKRNTRAYVCSIIDKENRKEIETSPEMKMVNRTSTKWMKTRAGLLQGPNKPSTAKMIEATRFRSQTAQKDSSGRKTTASTGNNESNKKFKNHIRYPDEHHTFIFQNSWIPNSYRMNNKSEMDRVESIIPK